MSAEQDKYFQLAKGGLPRLVFQLDANTQEILQAYAKLFGDSVQTQINEWLAFAYIDTATGIWLDQHAKDRGRPRQTGETDEQLRDRIRSTDDAVTVPNILARVNSFLDASGVEDDAVMVELPAEAAFCLDTPGDPEDADGYAFAFDSDETDSWSDRLSTCPPSGFVIIVPADTTDATIRALTVLLQTIRAAGFFSYVERAP